MVARLAAGSSAQPRRALRVSDGVTLKVSTPWPDHPPAPSPFQLDGPGLLAGEVAFGVLAFFPGAVPIGGAPQEADRNYQRRESSGSRADVSPVPLHGVRMPERQRSQFLPGRYRDAVWHPPDPDEPTSELYRLMPPRRRPSQLQEALDAAHGTGGPGDDGESTTPPRRRWRMLAAKIRPASRRVLGWAWALFTLTLAGVLSLVIYAALTGH